MLHILVVKENGGKKHKTKTKPHKTNFKKKKKANLPSKV